MSKVKLPPEVAEKYDLVDYGPGSYRQYWGRFGVIDLTTLTVSQADELHRLGWSKLKPKKSSALAPASGKK